MATRPQPELYFLGRYGLLLNNRSYEPMSVEQRPGLGTPLYGAALDQLLVHSIRRLNDPSPGAFPAFARIIGAGTKLYVNGGAAVDTGYSGNPLSLVPYRPEQSVQAWMYVADSNKMRKVRADGTNYLMGIAQPVNEPTAQIGALTYQLIEDFNAVGAWANGGTAGALSAVARVNTTIDKIVYDSGTTGWATVAAASMDQVGNGMLVTLNSGMGNQETVPVQSVQPACASTTIQSIAYDSGTTGACSIVPASARTVGGWSPVVDGGEDFPDDLPSELLGPPRGGSRPIRPRPVFPRPFYPRTIYMPGGIVPDAMVELNAGGGTDEVVKVLSVSQNPDGRISFRCVTVNNHVAGETITGKASIRVYLANTHAAAETLTTNCVQSTVTAGAGTLSLTSPFNLATIASRPVQDDDEIHLSIRVDNLANLSEVRIFFDIDATTNDFAHNALYYVVRQNDLAAMISGAVTNLAAQQQAVQRSVLDEYQRTGYEQPIYERPAYQRPTPTRFLNPAEGGNPIVPVPPPPVTPTQTGTGTGQWSEVRFKVKDLQRIGTDRSRTLGNVAAIRIQFQVTNSTVCSVDALWIGGSYGPDVGEIGAPILWRYRYRSSSTGAASNLSPPMRSGLLPRRQAVTITPTYSSDPQVDKIDYYRFGASLVDWTYIGTGTNAAPFVDVYDDMTIAASDLAELDNFQPFPTLDLPRSGTCNVSGTTVTWVSGDTFNPAWAPGSEVKIGGILYTLFKQPSSATRLEIVENGGTQTGATFEIPQATLLGQPLPALWGPVEENGTLFACGDPYQPGVLFFTKGQNADAAPDVNQLEISTPSDPLMNGCMMGRRAIVGSTERWWALYPDFYNVNQWAPIQLPLGRGLYCRWGIYSDGKTLWYIGKDGIYQSDGGPEQSLTDQQLYALFPHEGQPGTSVTVGGTTITPPDFTQTSALRLSGGDGYLYFDFKDTLGNYATLVYDTKQKGWVSYDVYGVPVLTHYAEEGSGVHATLCGGNDGNLYALTGSSDGAAEVPWAVWTRTAAASGEFQVFNGSYLGVRSSVAATVILTVVVDGASYAYTINTTGSREEKIYQILGPLKGKLLQYGLSSTKSVRVYLDKTQVQQKPWADTGGYQAQLVFAA